MHEGYKKLKRAVLKEEFVSLTGDTTSALVMQQFLYWLERVSDFDDMIKEIETIEESQSNITPRHGWIYKSYKEMTSDILSPPSEYKKVERIMKRFVDCGWVERRNNPNFGWDKTYQYRPSLLKISRDLNAIGYQLEGFKFDCVQPKGQGVQCDFSRDTEVCSAPEDSDFVLSKGQGVPSIGQGVRAIPETTTENKEYKKEKNAQARDYDFSKGKGVAFKPLPDDWEVLPALREKVKQDYGLTDAQITDAAKRFKAKYLGEGTAKNDWASMFMYWCGHYKEPRKVFEKIPKDKPKHIDTSNRTGMAPLAKVVISKMEITTVEKTPEEQLHSDIIGHLLHKGYVMDLHNSGLAQLKIEQIDGDCLRFKSSSEGVEASMGERHQEMILRAIKYLGMEINRIEFV
jgi:hypothetical protein